MGVNQSKVDGEYLPATPPRTPSENLTISVPLNDIQCSDPRSPNVCRTPIGEILGTKYKSHDFEMRKIMPLHSTEENPGALLKNKLLKELNYNLTDPRSPSQYLNRTPITFEDLETPPLDTSKESQENQFNLEDSFADLFVHNSIKSDNKVEAIDPRSPSLEIERTPIVFTNEIIEDEQMDVVETVPEIVIAAKSVSEAAPAKNQYRKSRLERHKAIYEDADQVYSTPKRSEVAAAKRTPLSCVANKTNYRSRSVENSIKSKKSRVPFTSYDDNVKQTLVDVKVSARNNENFSDLIEMW